MRDPRKTILLPVITMCVLLIPAMTTSTMGSSVMRHLSFEEAINGADLVVLGRVALTPEFATLESDKRANTHHEFDVEEYIKGEGPDELTVVTIGGKYWVETEAGPILHASISTAPQLPPEGSEILLFLRSTRAGYAIHSASHGVIPVEVDSEGRRTVRLSFGRIECMPDDVRQTAETRIADGYKMDGRTLLGIVPVNEIKYYARLALTPRP